MESAKMAKLLMQSVVGLLVVVATYVVGAFLTTMLPGSGGKYMNPLGELIVAALIFVTTLVLGVFARFTRITLFISLGLTLVFEIVVLTILSGGHWSGDLQEVWSHTLLPVGISAITILLIRMYQKRRSASAANGSQPIRSETNSTS
jgi:hypothetical protein